MKILEGKEKVYKEWSEIGLESIKNEYDRD